MIAPLPIPAEQLVIVAIVDGTADTTLVHLPAVRCNKGGFRFDSYDFPPATWPPQCGGIRSGWVYVKAGLLEDATLCPDCAAAVEPVFICQIDESAGMRDTAA